MDPLKLGMTRNADDGISIAVLMRSLAIAIKLYRMHPILGGTVKRLDRELQDRLVEQISSNDDAHRDEIGRSCASPEFLTAAQAARELGVSREILRLMRQTGLGPKHSMRIMRKVVIGYDRRDLDKWVELTARKDAKGCYPTQVEKGTAKRES